jgi:hypothetical protein
MKRVLFLAVLIVSIVEFAMERDRMYLHLYGCGLAGSDLQLAPTERADSRYSRFERAC